MENQRAPRPEQEDFGEASLGDAQSSNPPADPEMIEEDRTREPQDTEKEALAEERARNGADNNVSERQPGAEGGRDPDAGPTLSAEQINQDEERGQAEG